MGFIPVIRSRERVAIDGCGAIIFDVLNEVIVLPTPSDRPLHDSLSPATVPFEKDLCAQHLLDISDVRAVGHQREAIRDLGLLVWEFLVFRAVGDVLVLGSQVCLHHIIIGGFRHFLILLLFVTI